MNNVKDYGAIGDGIALDSVAIQKAIDAGGMAYLPAGKYRCGTLYLKSNGGLHLDAGAVIIASHNREDYNADDYCPQNMIPTEQSTAAHLISVVEQQNVTIEGHGIIEGESRYWMNESNLIPGTPCYAPNPERPGQMIYFCECQNVHVTDVQIRNGPYWHMFFHGCEDVYVRGVKIQGDRLRWTNDGIDIECCSRVTVSNCIVDVGDDAITVRGYDSKLLYKEHISEQITIMNCILRSARDYGVRLGVGTGLIRNCTFSNLDIEAPTCGGIGIMSRWHRKTKNLTSVENILVCNANIRAKRPLELIVGVGEAPLCAPCFVRNLRLNNLMLFPTEKNVLTGLPDVPLENVALHNVTVVLPAEDLPGAATEIAYVRNLTMNDYQVIAGNAPEVAISHSERITINGVSQ